MSFTDGRERERENEGEHTDREEEDEKGEQTTDTLLSLSLSPSLTDNLSRELTESFSSLFRLHRSGCPLLSLLLSQSLLLLLLPTLILRAIRFSSVQPQSDQLGGKRKEIWPGVAVCLLCCSILRRGDRGADIDCKFRTTVFITFVECRRYCVSVNDWSMRGAMMA